MRRSVRAGWAGVVGAGMMSAAVGDLLFWGSPAAIGGRIRPIVVNTVERHADWRLSHVGKKVEEIIPPFTDGYASATPVFEARVLGVETPLPHCIPATVNHGIFSCLSMFEVKFAPKTTAAGGLSPSQVPCRKEAFASAVAKAAPLRLSLVHDDCPTTEPLACEVFEGGHAGILPHRILQ